MQEELYESPTDTDIALYYSGVFDGLRHNCYFPPNPDFWKKKAIDITAKRFDLTEDQIVKAIESWEDNGEKP